MNCSQRPVTCRPYQCEFRTAYRSRSSYTGTQQNDADHSESHGKVQSTIASHRMAIGKTAHMERSLGNRYLDHGIFSANSRQRFRKSLSMGNTVSEEPPLVSLSENELPFSLKNGKRPASEYVLGWDNATQLAPRDMSKLKQ